MSRDGVDALYSPRRTLLDRVLVDAAVDAGAAMINDVRALQEPGALVAAAQAGVPARARSMDDLRPAALKALRLGLFVISTHGEGDPPEEAVELFEERGQTLKCELIREKAGDLFGLASPRYNMALLSSERAARGEISSSETADRIGIC